MIIKTILSTGLIMVVLTSCYYDNSDTLYPNANANCDTINVLFTPTASDIIYQSCATTNCHVVGTGRVLLTNYNEVKASIDQGNFIIRALDRKNMPPAGPLSSCEIKVLNAWINDGALNN